MIRPSSLSDSQPLHIIYNIINFLLCGTLTLSQQSQGAKKIIFTACHSGKLKLAFTSPDVISISPKTFWWAEFISQFFCYSHFSKNITCPSGKLRTEFTSPMAKSTSPGLLDITFFARWEYLMEFCKVTLTIESADEILWCDHSNESSPPILTNGAICFSKFHKTIFENLVEICFWLDLAVKGLKNQQTLCQE